MTSEELPLDICKQHSDYICIQCAGKRLVVVYLCPTVTWANVFSACFPSVGQPAQRSEARRPISSTGIFCTASTIWNILASWDCRAAWLAWLWTHLELLQYFFSSCWEQRKCDHSFDNFGLKKLHSDQVDKSKNYSISQILGLSPSF